MKKLAVVLALAVSGFVNGQELESLRWAFIGYNQSSVKFLKDINYTEYCSAEIRNAIETNIMDSLITQFNISTNEVSSFKTQFNKYKIAKSFNYNKVKNITTSMRFSDWLDIKSNYNPLFNISRNSNLYVSNIVSIKTDTLKYKAIEIVEMYSIDYEHQQLIYVTNIFVQDINGKWDGIYSDYAEGEVDCSVCPSF
jgi:hypothetical protein